MLETIAVRDILMQRRQGVSEAKVAMMCRVLLDNKKLPPIIVFRDVLGGYVLVEGNHRVFSHVDVGRLVIVAKVFDTRQEARDEFASERIFCEEARERTA